ncbi:hypothetical protein Tco_0923218 [Tanacetum coccineum]|uniref:Uncharacterized protein n=1 Tax=Tanacetum coccineum TaxID=301880 RepID=A0ABQ5D7J0_9ASTR
MRPNLGALQIGIKSQDTVMSDYEDSTITYTAVSSPFGGLSDIRSLGVVGPYVQVALQAPTSPDYITGLEEPQSPPPPDFIPEHVYPEFMPLEDEILLVEEQPLPATDSPIADSPGYIPESDPEEDPEEDVDEDPEEDLANYPADGGDDGDDKDEPSDDDEDEEVDIEADDQEEEEHPAFSDSSDTFSTTTLDTITTTSIITTTSDFLTTTTSIITSACATSTSHSLPLPPPIILSHTRPDVPSSGTPPFYLLSTDRRADRPEVTLPPRKRLGIALGPGYKVGESSSAAAARPAGGLRADYVEAMQGTLVVTDVAEFSQRMTEFETKVRQDTDEIYTRGYVVMYSGGSTAGSDYRATCSRPQEAGDDYRDIGGRSQEAEAVHRGTKAVEETSDSDDRVREIVGTRQRSCIARCTRGGW